MKHIIPFKKDINYKIGVFTIKEASKFYTDFIKRNNYYEIDDYSYHTNYELKSKINYFDDNDFDTYWTSKKYNETCRLFIAYDDKDIFGIGKFAFWDSSQKFSVSYVSTNKDFFKQGVSKNLLNKIFEYFSKTYPTETLFFSGYSIDGWSYLRKYILEISEKYNVKISEKGIEYPGLSGKFSKEDYELMSKSRKEINKKYGDI